MSNTSALILLYSPPGETTYQHYTESTEGPLVFSWSNWDASRVRTWKVKTTDKQPTDFSRNDATHLPLELSFKDYHANIKKLIAKIKLKNWNKVVFSRVAVKQQAWSDTQILARYEELVQKYPDSCTYLFSHPDWGLWIGATPETLLTWNGGALTTMSLAGTRSLDERDHFAGKEEHEQQLVTDFIHDILKRHKARNITIEEPQQIEAGPVVHYKTVLKGTINSAHKVENLLQDLHPTPAVAGSPRAEAMEFIREKEGYSRESYTGFFGFREHHRQQYFVNLRCMQIFPGAVAYYAGGGITAQSEPEREWRETEEKLRTLLSVFHEN